MEKIVDLYKRYVDYTNTEKMLPNEVDGLLTVHRRLLLTLHQMAKNGYVKTAAALGYLMGNYHPHAEASSVAETIVRNGFADGGGQWGSSIGIEPISAAASRYTKIKSNNYIENIAFKYIDDVEWIDGELNNKEPPILPTQFPLCLFGNQELVMIACGFKTEIPIYTKEDLLKRLKYLLKIEKEEPVIKPNLYNCKITSNKKELKEVLEKGQGKIKLTGLFKEFPEKNIIYIHGWNPRIGFNAILNKIDRYKKYNLLSDEYIGYIDESTVKDGTKIRFEVLKQRNVDQIYTKMKDAIEDSLRAEIGYNIYVVDENKKVKLSSIDTMLLKSYNFYKNAFENNCKNSINTLKQKMKEFEIIEKIKDHISECTKLKTFEKMVEYLYNKTSINKEDIEIVIKKYKISSLLETKGHISDLKNDLSIYQNKLKNLEDSVLKDYEN